MGPGTRAVSGRRRGLLVRREAWTSSALQLRTTCTPDTVCAAGCDRGWKAGSSGRRVVHLGNATAADAVRIRAGGTLSRSEAHLVKERLSPPSAILSILFTAAGLVARTAVFRLVRQPDRAAIARAQLRGYLSLLR